MNWYKHWCLKSYSVIPIQGSLRNIWSYKDYYGISKGIFRLDPTITNTSSNYYFTNVDVTSIANTTATNGWYGTININQY